MSTVSGQIHICGYDEVDQYQKSAITHFIRISNPKSPSDHPSWFSGEYLLLQFGDVFSETDARACNTRAVNMEDIQSAIEFANQADGDILISCDYGASRSPAIATVILADRLGAGKEKEAIDKVISIRPDSVPNEYVVRLGDEYLGRGGKLLAALREAYETMLS